MVRALKFGTRQTPLIVTEEASGAHKRGADPSISSSTSPSVELIGTSNAPAPRHPRFNTFTSSNPRWHRWGKIRDATTVWPCNNPSTAHAYPLSGGGMSEAGFPGFDGLSGLRSADGSVAPNPAHPINPVNLASDKLPKWLPRTQFVIARSEVRRWRMAISFQERRSLPRRDCRAALAMTVWGRLPRCARNDSLGKIAALRSQ